jgi:5-oxoprolinase (ATP-hydrolysing)
MEVFIDRGGTFTDCILVEPSTDTLRVVKVLSSDRAPIEGIRRLLQLEPTDALPPLDVRMGTTIATNALLEKKGRRAALAITRGFGDLPEIGTQARPELFALQIVKPAPLPQSVLEIDARLHPDGSVATGLDPDRLERELRALRDAGAETLAVVVLHAYRSGALEREVGEIARRAGFDYVALSHEVAPELGLLSRADTTVLDAALTPLVRSWAEGLGRELAGGTLRVMQSSGGLTDALRLRGPDAILSGPAGGAVAVARVAELGGERAVIGFDMGGTSTDVCRFAGELERVYELEVAGARVQRPALRVLTVAAGGGSLCRLEGARLTVGPESAGADPGPLAYGNPEARELALTDINLLLGRLVEDRFPLPLERSRASARLAELAAELCAQGVERDPMELAEGFFHVANSNMTEAIRKVSVARGHDPREHALVVLGGAGGQHACALAARLGIARVLFHPLAGVLSAWGIGLSDVSWHGERDAGRGLLDPDALDALDAEYRALEDRGREELGRDAGSAESVRRIDLRYRGSDSALTLPLLTAERLAERFEQEHTELFGTARPGHPIELVTARVELLVRRERMPGTPSEAASAGVGPPAPARRTRLYHDGGFLEDVPVFQREALAAGTDLVGPALVLEATGTIVIDPGFSARVESGGLIVARPIQAALARPELRHAGPRPDPVLLEIMGNLFMSIAEQMGESLRRTAFSTNIRERLDFSCALFEKDGSLVANAPHIPVHLGAMSESVRALIADQPNMQPGDAFVSNDPARGGSHLPDVTVVSPVHDAAGELTFFTACRGHHADIGGVTPGSMPAFSRALSEEGVVLRALCIARSGRLDREALLGALGNGPYPARDPLANLADIEAQLAANHTGARLLGELCERYGTELVSAYMRHVADDAAARVAREIARLPDGDHAFEDALDDGTPIRVRLAVQGERMLVDFSGTGGEQEGNLNAPRAVTVAAVIYFLRTLVGAAIPLNSGCLRPVELRIPPGSVLSPGPERAVAGGNVETSQRVVDVLFGALGRVAASQGTMNNLSFGGEGFSYYETIAGGAGAGDGFDGASAVHTHMTNTRITDAEVLETRFPVRLLAFALRRGSGGAGRHHGGDGVIRELEFLAPAEVSILSERRVRAPFGLAGGEPGARGRNALNGCELGGRASFRVVPGDRLRIETPGGGGFGRR